LRVPRGWSVGDAKHTPFRVMHFSPTSRMNSAVLTGPADSGAELAVSYKASIDSGEFIVMDVAVLEGQVWLGILDLYTNLSREREVDVTLTAMVNHAGRPTCFDFALSATDWNSALTFLGAGMVFGLACAALMSAFNDGDNLDILILNFFFSLFHTSEVRGDSGLEGTEMILLGLEI